MLVELEEENKDAGNKSRMFSYPNWSDESIREQRRGGGEWTERRMCDTKLLLGLTV